MPFSKRTFDLLAELKADGRYAYVQQNRADFDTHVIEPFQEFFDDVLWPRIPAHIFARLNTDTRVFGLLNRNDFGKGGAHAFYWAALSPRRASNKQHDAQLLTFLAPSYLEYGFFFGWETPDEYLHQFQKNAERLLGDEEALSEVVAFLEDYVPNGSFIIRDNGYNPETYQPGPVGSLIHKTQEYIWDGVLAVIPELPLDDLRSFSPMKVLDPATVLKMTSVELADDIVLTFIGLFPLFVLATAADPVQQLREYMAQTDAWANEDLDALDAPSQ